MGTTTLIVILAVCGFHYYWEARRREKWLDYVATSLSSSRGWLGWVFCDDNNLFINKDKEDSLNLSWEFKKADGTVVRQECTLHDALRWTSKGWELGNVICYDGKSFRPIGEDDLDELFYPYYLEPTKLDRSYLEWKAVPITLRDKIECFEKVLDRIV